MPNQTASATKHRQYRNAGCIEYEGSFTTAGSSAPSVTKGLGFTVSAPTTGVYTVTFDRQFYDYIGFSAVINGATGTNDAVYVTAIDPNPGTTNATMTIETQSAAGTAADLTGPIVSFRVVWSLNASQ